MKLGRAALVVTVALLSLSSCEEKPSVSVAPAAAAKPITWDDGAAPSGQNAYQHTQAFCDMGPRPSNSEAYEQQLQYLERELQAKGWQTRREQLTGKGVPMTNLIATYGGGDAVRPLLLSCHIDTKIDIHENFVSANDGASGAGALIEIARVLTLTPEQAQQVEIIFLDGEEAFAHRMTEEDGLYGSKFDAAKRAEAGRLPHWQINLDMVGGRRVPIAPPIADTSDFMYAQYMRAVRELQLSPERWTVAPTSYLDDHIPYLDQGVDSLNLIAHFVGSDWWHTEKDNMSLICPYALHDSCRVTLKLVEQLLGVLR